MRKVFFILFFLFPSLVFADLPYVKLSFPRDEGAHYAFAPYPYYRLMEWWYVNGIATSDSGRTVSFDFALFNPAYNLGGTVLTRPLVHLQLSDLDKQKAYGVSKLFDAVHWIHGKISNWALSINFGDDFFMKKVRKNGRDMYIVKAHVEEEGNDISLDLLLEPKSDYFLINENGLMPMENNTNSYYYTIPHMQVTGAIKLNGEELKINQQPGDAWMDHQWGDFDVSQSGWEWFSIRLENGLVGNIFLIFDYKTMKVVNGLANIILPDGQKKFIPYRDFYVNRKDYWFDPEMEVSYPLTFDFDFPQLNLRLSSTASFPEQEVHGYWEGHTQVSGHYGYQPVKGYSYTELVYASPSDLTKFPGH